MLIKNKSLLLFLALLFYLYFRGIGDHGLIDPLEGINASVELHMLASGNYFVPRIGSSLVAGKNMGTYWLSAIAIKIFGWGEFAVRFWSALSGIGMILAASMSAKRDPEDSNRKSWFAAVICASMTLCFTVSQVASSHALYACFTGLAMTGIIKSENDKRWLILAHFSCVLALIVHGPEGIILPFLTVILFALLNDNFSYLKNFFSWIPGVIISIAGVGLYFITLINGNPFLLHYMRCENAGISSENFLGILFFIFVGFTPWHGFLIRAVWESVNLGDKSNPRVFMILWASIFGIFAILMTDFLALASCIPALSALLGDIMDSWLRKNGLESIKASVAMNIFILLPMIILIVPVVIYAFPELAFSLLSLIPWGLFVLLFLFACWYYTKTRQILKWARNVPAAALLCLMPLAGVFNLTAEARSIRDIGLRLRDTVQKNDLIAQYGVNYPSVYFYTIRDSILVDAELLSGVEQKKFVIDDKRLHALWTGRGRLFLIMPQNKRPVQPLPQNVFHIMEYDGMLLLSNQ